MGDRTVKADHLSLADALAFENFTDEQKRIAYAGVELHARMEQAREEGHREGYDQGKRDGHAEYTFLDKQQLADEIDEQANKLALAIPLLPTGHTAEAELRTIRRALTDIVDTLRNG